MHLQEEKYIQTLQAALLPFVKHNIEQQHQHKAADLQEEHFFWFSLKDQQKEKQQ